MPTMKFTIEKERENTITFLDITIEKEHDKLIFDTYRKPTTTDSIIPCDSCHPTEHKMAAVRYLTNRMNKYYLSTASKDKERKIIKHILQENKYDTSIIDINPKTKNSKKKTGTKWAKFTYAGKETKFITKLLKNSSMNVSYTTRNTIGRLLSQRSIPKKKWIWPQRRVSMHVSRLQDEICGTNRQLIPYKVFWIFYGFQVRQP